MITKCCWPKMCEQLKKKKTIKKNEKINRSSVKRIFMHKYILTLCIKK